VILLPANIRVAPANLAARCVGRRVVGYPYADLWPDEVVVTKDTVFGYERTLREAGLTPERDDVLTQEVIRIMRAAYVGHRPDGRVFYTLSPETVAERADRMARIKREVKSAVAGVRAGALRDKGKAAGVLELFA